MKCVAVASLLLFAVLPAFADSINVFVQQNSVDGHTVGVQLPPDGNPLLHCFPCRPPLASSPELLFDVSFETRPGEHSVGLQLFLGSWSSTFVHFKGVCNGPCSFNIAFVTPSQYPSTVHLWLISMASQRHSPSGTSRRYRSRPP
jgi:hypothetical protein